MLVAPSATTTPLVVTQGDPEGIGPELLLALAADGELRPQDRVFASPAVLDRVVAQVDRPWARAGRSALVPVLVAAGQDPEPGPSQLDALARAVDWVLTHPGAALVTAPIDKRVCVDAGFAYAGHTEYLAARGDTEDFAMFMVGPTLRVALTTIHVPLSTVAGLVSISAIERVVKLVIGALRRDFSIPRPRLAVLGLNPHAGEEGVLGSEESTVIAPAVAACQRWAREAGIDAQIVGPLPADGAFAAHANGEHDAVVAMYHDQGLAPFKVLHFADGINVTLGLPFVRTSPDHGTAKDIAGQGRADPSSMRAAMTAAREFGAARRRAASR